MIICDYISCNNFMVTNDRSFKSVIKKGTRHIVIATEPRKLFS